ncbi:MAG: murein biosynthesis integral membrane protein MurJ [Ardenticatenaceae bacterium]|nr:murein biosynthesis integral membrane protein MurJ [Ardenticatenaceae bacterium]
MAESPLPESLVVEKQSRVKVWGRTVSLMMVLTLLGQLLAFARETAVAAKFGAGEITDAFFLAIVLPNALLLIIQNGLMMAVVPILADIFTLKGEEAAWRVTSNVINLSLIITLFLGGVLVIGADLIILILAPTISPESHILAVRMLRLLAPVGLLGGLVSILTGILNVYRVYVLPTLFGLVMNVSMIAGTLLLANRFSAYALVIATLVGYLIQLFILVWPLLKVQKYSLVIDLKDQVLGKITQLAWPAITILLFQQIVVVADRTVASRLGIGNVAALTFAARLILPASTLLIGPVSTITLPEMARIAATDNKKRIQELSSKILRYILFVTVPVAVNLLILSKPIVSLLLEHGAFTSAATDVTSEVMAFYVLTLLGVTSREVIVRFLFAHQESKIPLYSGFIRMVVNLVLNVVLARLIGIKGIALANGVAILLDVIIMTVVLIKRKLLIIQTSFFVKIFGAALVTTLVAYSISKVTQNQWSAIVTVANLLTTIVLVGIASMIAYIVSSLLFSITESRILAFTAMNYLKSSLGKIGLSEK